MMSENKGVRITVWRTLRDENIHHLYFSLSFKVIKSRMIWAGHVACLGANNANILERKPNGKRPYGRQL
jgi:hypothetical protein